jgi:tRNA dimethylallyltransferase
MEISRETVGAAGAVLIAGPTASGKSAAALRLAEDLAQSGRKAWIVNADSMQVYDGLRILTARPTLADEARVPHRLYGHVPPETRYSAGHWLRDIAPVLDEARSEGALPIVIGGTGLYFKALTDGLAHIPEVPADALNRWTGRLAAEGAAGLHGSLVKRDPVSAALIRASDSQRIVRALSVLDATGIGLVEWQKERTAPPLLDAGRASAFVMETDRAELYRRIDERFDRMAASGAIEEVEALLERNLDPTLPAMKAIGVAAFADALAGRIPLAQAVERAKTETRRYAKRQATWFRHQAPGWRRITQPGSWA